MSNEPDWLDGLYAEGSDEQPPAELDTRIKSAARRRIRHPWYLSPGRLTTLATAASLVIAASVIYFDPVEETLLKEQEPAERILEETVMEAGQEDAVVLKPAPSREVSNETKRQSPGRLERIRADADLEDIAVTASEAQMQAPSSQTDARSMQTDPVGKTEASVVLELERLCGPLPGNRDNRTITSDNGGWLVTVSIGSDRRSWRCQDGAWISADSEQQ
jgi:hypothetical protein